jgi:hypothetical protein
MWSAVIVRKRDELTGRSAKAAVACVRGTCVRLANQSNAELVAVQLRRRLGAVIDDDNFKQSAWVLQCMQRLDQAL